MDSLAGPDFILAGVAIAILIAALIMLFSGMLASGKKL